MSSSSNPSLVFLCCSLHCGMTKFGLMDHVLFANLSVMSRAQKYLFSRVSGKVRGQSHGVVILLDLAPTICEPAASSQEKLIDNE